jgi:hypothetical protein
MISSICLAGRRDVQNFILRLYKSVRPCRIENRSRRNVVSAGKTPYKMRRLNYRRNVEDMYIYIYIYIYLYIFIYIYARRTAKRKQTNNNNNNRKRFQTQWVDGLEGTDYIKRISKTPAIQVYKTFFKIRRVLNSLTWLTVRTKTTYCARLLKTICLNMVIIKSRNVHEPV